MLFQRYPSISAWLTLNIDRELQNKIKKVVKELNMNIDSAEKRPFDYKRWRGAACSAFEASETPLSGSRKRLPSIGNPAKAGFSAKLNVKMRPYRRIPAGSPSLRLNVNLYRLPYLTPAKTPKLTLPASNSLDQSAIRRA
jgi:hypothetical protein